MAYKEKDFTNLYTEANKKLPKIEIPPPDPTGPRDESGNPTFANPKDFEAGTNKFAEESAKIIAPTIYKFTEDKATEIAESISQKNDALLIERLAKLRKEHDQLEINFGDLQTNHRELQTAHNTLQTQVTNLEATVQYIRDYLGI